MASKVTKVYTGFAGLPVCPNPHEELVFWFNRILRKLTTLPSESKYRSITEELINKRKDIVESTPEPKDVEAKIGFQCEQIIEQAKSEYHLIETMSEFKPWEPLVEKPHENQWKWPI